MTYLAPREYFGSLRTEFKSKYDSFDYDTYSIIYSGYDDEEYQNYLKIRHLFMDITYGQGKVTELSGSIFSAAPDFSLAISVSADLKMNYGIAAKFKERYSCIEIFKEQKAETGGIAFVKQKNTERFIYYLVVMPVSDVGPTYYTVWMAIQKLKESVMKYQIKKIAMSYIGCGIDCGVTWTYVKPMINYTFKDISIEINAYEGKSPCKRYHDIEDCYCYGYSLIPSKLDSTYAKKISYNQGAKVLKNEKKKNNNFKYWNQSDKENIFDYNSLLGKGSFWDNTSKMRDFYKYGTQVGHSAYNTFKTQTDTNCSTFGEAYNLNTQNEEDVYHMYYIKVGTDYYVKYSTEDAANDYYGALY